jgi:hypothetical protein
LFVCSTESSLDFGVSASSVRLGVTAGNTEGSPVASGFSLLGSSEEEGVGSGRSLHDELVEGHASTTSGDDSGTGGLGESESGNVKLGHIEGSLIIGDNSDNDGSAASVLSEASDHAGDGHWGSVDSGGNESSEDGLAETGVGSSAQEGEELYE